MTDVQWAGAVILAASLTYWTAVAFKAAGERVRAARRAAFDRHVTTAGIRTADWDIRELTGGER